MTREIADITDFIFLNDPLSPADVIFIPGNWSVELPEEAARLYREGLAPLVVPSGKYSVKTGFFPGPRAKENLYPPPYTTEAAFFKAVMVKNGVPDKAIVPEERATYTYQNALFSREILNERGIRPQKAIIVCRSPHARRCLMAYRLCFPDTFFMVHGVDCEYLPHRATWHENEEDMRHVLDELQKCGGQLMELMIERYIGKQ